MIVKDRVSLRRDPFLAMKTLLVITLLAAAAWPSGAQDSWSLDRCISYALEHNLNLREQRLETAARQDEWKQRQWAMLPTLSVSVGEELNWGRSVDMQELIIIRNKLTHATGASINASVTLFDGLAGYHGSQAAWLAASAARHDTDNMQQSLTLDVTRAYLQLMLARQIHAYACERHATIVLQRERTASLVETGSQPKSALDEIEAQVASEKAAMVDAACQVRTATLTLTRLMNLPGETTFTAGEAFGQDSIARRIPVITETQVEDYVQGDPRILSARARLAESRHHEARAKAALYPSLRLGASYGTYYSSAADSRFGTQFEENRNPSLTIQLDIPVFNSMQTISEVRRSQRAADRAALQLEKARSGVEEEVRSAAIEAENCCQKYLSSEEKLRAMQNLLDVTEAKYNLGAATALDYIVARNNHFKAVSDFLQAKWQYLFQLKLLERYRP